MFHDFAVNWYLDLGCLSQIDNTVRLKGGIPWMSPVWGRP